MVKVHLTHGNKDGANILIFSQIRHFLGKRNRSFGSWGVDGVRFSRLAISSWLFACIFSIFDFVLFNFASDSIIVK